MSCVLVTYCREYREVITIHCVNNFRYVLWVLINFRAFLLDENIIWRSCTEHKLDREWSREFDAIKELNTERLNDKLGNVSQSTSSLLRWYISTAAYHLVKIDQETWLLSLEYSAICLFQLVNPPQLDRHFQGNRRCPPGVRPIQDVRLVNQKFYRTFYVDRLLMKQNILLLKYFFQIFFITAVSYLSIPKYCPANL